MHTVLYCCPQVNSCSVNQESIKEEIYQQQCMLVQYCRAHSMPIDAIYTDVNPSFSLHDRPALQALLRDAQNNEFLNVLCPSLEILCCNHLLQSIIIQLLRNHQIHFISNFPANLLS
ncbi:MAG: recombinase family protein [Lachnospiraceae bacterium]